MADCYEPPGGHDQCSFSCPQSTYWKGGGGTAPMHRFQFSVVDDGTNSGPISEVIHLKLSTLDDTVVSDQDWSEVCSEISDHPRRHLS